MSSNVVQLKIPDRQFVTVTPCGDWWTVAISTVSFGQMETETICQHDNRDSAYWQGRRVAARLKCPFLDDYDEGEF